jgi:hypothetical protein
LQQVPIICMRHFITHQFFGPAVISSVMPRQQAARFMTIHWLLRMASLTGTAQALAVLH